MKVYFITWFDQVLDSAIRLAFMDEPTARAKYQSILQKRRYKVLALTVGTLDPEVPIEQHLVDALNLQTPRFSDLETLERVEGE